ncbi:MAG: hypothetical protein R6X02_32495 [Enhygromyxa sp.]
MDLLDRIEAEQVASVAAQTLYRRMLLGAEATPSVEVIAWALREPDSTRPLLLGRDDASALGWWVSDSWGRVAEFRPNPWLWARERGVEPRDPYPYPLEGR